MERTQSSSQGPSQAKMSTFSVAKIWLQRHQNLSKQLLNSRKRKLDWSGRIVQIQTKLRQVESIPYYSSTSTSETDLTLRNHPQSSQKVTKSSTLSTESDSHEETTITNKEKEEISHRINKRTKKEKLHGNHRKAGYFKLPINDKSKGLRI
ncbi:hypothetical protein O181_075536 [Austropuccinia psidii MF-1]|uniref:Uncharacterized protein n=1 Tax=Austropuccinia psidii MF-1 TaxID=1389203 RepID=A0A9Q3FES2_9BASI|nr:hypothetical protein [Austropuccinia psidii MF-1]